MSKEAAPRRASKVAALGQVNCNGGSSAPLVSGTLKRGIDESETRIVMRETRNELNEKHERKRNSLLTCPSSASRQAKPTEEPKEQSEADALSVTTTTSEVNSNDDAASIASRLSQIVVEQEEKLLDFGSARQARANSLEAGPKVLRRQNMREQAARARRNSADLSSASSTLNGRSLELGPGEPRSERLPEIHVFKDFDHSERRPPAASPLAKRSRAQSVAGSPVAGRSASPQVKFQQHDEREDDELDEGLVLRAIDSCASFAPERGDLRELSHVRRNSAANQLGCVCQKEAAELQPGAKQRLRSNTAGSIDPELILNIRRSAWTLSEFDQTFTHNNNNNNYNRHPADGSSSSLNKSISDLSELSGAERHQLAAAGASSASTSLNNNNNKLLIRASRNAISLSQQQQQLQLAATLNNGSLAAALEAGAALKGDAAHSRRPSYAPSTASFASSLDSFTWDRAGAPLADASAGAPSEPAVRKRKNGCTELAFAKKRLDEERSESGAECCCSCAGFAGNLTRCCSMRTLAQHLPIFAWLPNYKLSQLWGDLMAGMAVAVLNISTSMSAAVVAGTDFGVAFRASIVNTFVYSILCSSRHTSFGSWSIMSQMLLVSVRRALSDELILARLNMGPSTEWRPEEYEKWHLNIIIMYTFLIGLIQFVCGLLNLGNILASFIPEALCSSMITATAFSMAVGQLANMAGTSNRILWSIERNTTELWADLKNAPVDITDLFADLFRWVKQIALLIKYHDQINMVCVIISVSSVVLLYLNQYVIQKQLERHFKRKIFIPSEMILLVLMIIVSNVLVLNQKYDVTTCGPIHIDFMIPALPNLKLIRELWFESVATALISYTMVYVMAKTYSNKFNYEVDCNQELIACGAGNLVGGLFDALPATASFSRTAGQVEAGGQTQMASIINCLLLIILAQILGPYVAELPVCVMAATLFFGFVKMMSRFSDVFMYWRVCKVDFAIWLVTFIAILTLDIVNGFVYGFIFSILTMLYRAQNRRCYMLGSIGTSDVYVPLVKYPLAEEIDGIKIFQFCGPIHYVCAELFERLLRHKTRVDVKQILQHINEQEVVKFNPKDSNLPTHIILDFSMISFIDSAGIRTIKKIIEDYQRVNITILLASLASHVAAVVKSEPSLWNVYKNRFYVTLVDAVHCALRDSRLQTIKDQSVKVVVA